MAVDANRNALASIPLTFSVDNGGVIVPNGTATGTSGTLTGSLRIGSDQSSRTLTVRATSGSVTRVLPVQVSGSRLQPSAYSGTVSTGSANNLVKYLLTDNAGNKMVNYPITVQISGANAVTGVTNSNGEYDFRYTAPTTAGSVVLTANAGGVSESITVTVSSSSRPPDASVAVESPSLSVSPNVVAVNTSGSTANSVEVRALFLGANNAPVQNIRVWFDLAGDPNSIGGTLASSVGGVLYTDANGVARTTYAPGARHSPKDGVRIRACWSRTDFTPPGEGGACPVTGQEVSNTLTVTSETLSVTVGTDYRIGTGTSGLTYTQYFAVQVVDSAGVARQGVTITPSLDIVRYYMGHYRAGSTAWIRGGAGQTYLNRASTDTALQKPDTAVLVGTVGQWAAGNVAVCENEDLNRNGVVESNLVAEDAVTAWYADPANGRLGQDANSEDQNSSFSIATGRPALDPRKADITVSAPNGFVSDSSGLVVLKIEYPRNVASWLRYNLMVTASGVSGTEGRANFSDDLWVLASDANNINATPAFAESPYGSQYLGLNAQGVQEWLPAVTAWRRNRQDQSAYLCLYPK
jgi:hypothetical protein